MNLVKRDKIDITQQCSVDEIIINVDGEAEGGWGVRGFLQLWVNWEGMSPNIFFKIDSLVVVMKMNNSINARFLEEWMWGASYILLQLRVDNPSSEFVTFFDRKGRKYI